MRTANATADLLGNDVLLERCGSLRDDIRQFAARMAGNLPVRPGPDDQFLMHGHAWVETLVGAIDALVGWAGGLQAHGRLGTLERRLLGAGCAEYLGQITAGIAMSQDEVFRPGHLGMADEAHTLALKYVDLTDLGIDRTGGAILAEINDRGSLGDAGLDETLTMIARQFGTFADERIAPYAQDWHRNDQLVPIEIVNELAELGVFGLTISETYGGSDMGKLAMCVVTEELSRGYIGVGSLGTRSEIAGELIMTHGTDAQKKEFLPRIVDGSLLPAAVFTEPNTGSDLAHLRTRAESTGGGWRLNGQKTWITHAARADLMTVLARTNPDNPGHKGLSLFLLRKTRGNADNDFPDAGISGEEIEVLGYRGMKEYTLAFDDVDLPSDALLGMKEGQGFMQLMSTFEGARIQTAARAVGVAQNAFELAHSYASERIQFGEPLARFQRVYGKLARMAVDIVVARQLTYAAARAKDAGRRCDIEAGMAKLLAARAAWSCADNALQIHGGNGYAVEYPISRVLCDARILNVFEGAAEIQAEVIARGLKTARDRSAVEA